MIKVTCTHEEMTYTVKGSVLEVLADIGCVIQKIHFHILENSSEAAEQFRDVMRRMVCDPTSPVFQDSPSEKKGMDVKYGAIELAGCKDKGQVKELIRSCLTNMDVPPDAVEGIADTLMEAEHEK